MDQVLKINEMLALVASNNGINGLELSTEGVCTLQYDRNSVVLQYVVSANYLSLYAPVAAESVLLDGEGRDAASLYRTILALNLYSIDLLGATFAYIPDEGLVALTDRIHMEHLDAAILEARLNTFLLLTEVWKYRLLNAESLQDLMQAMSEKEVEGLILGAHIQPPSGDAPHSSIGSSPLV